MAFTISQYLPSPLLEEIRKYLRAKGNSAHRRYSHNSADEDSVTGAFGELIHRETSSRRINGAIWKWGMASTKFTGKGRDAQESIIGADAVIEFRIEDNSGNAITKALLFQAKKEGSKRGLTSQVEKMEKVAEGSSAVIDYSSGAYRAIGGSEYLESLEGGDRLAAGVHGMLVGDYLADVFLECTAGIPGMSYDAATKELKVPTDRIGTISIPARVRRRIRIAAVGPIQF